MSEINRPLLPAIPEPIPTPESLYETVLVLKQAVELLLGHRKPKTTQGNPGVTSGVTTTTQDIISIGDITNALGGKIDSLPNAIIEAHINDAAVSASKLQDGAVTLAKFASGITPVEIVGALPSTGNFDGRLVYLTTDKKLYRYNATAAAWTAAVATVDLTGQITTTQITDGAISTPKISANAVTANEIAANTITAAQIAADTITAGQIAAGAINASELAAGAVVAGKIAAGTIVAADIASKALTVANLSVVNFDNLFQNAGLDTGAISPHTGTPNGGTWDVTTTLPRSGAYSLRYNPSGQTSAAFANMNGTITDTLAHIRCGEGDSFYAEAYARKSGSAGGNNVRLRMQFHDSTGANITFTDGALVTPTNAYQKITVTATAPAGTSYVLVRAFVTFGGLADNIHFDDFYMRQRFTGSLVVDGSIVAVNIAAGTITGDKIAAATITGDKINANTIAADRIVAASISTDRLAVGGVETTNIATSAITEAVTAYTAASVSATSDVTWTDAQSAVVTTTANDKVLVLSSAKYFDEMTTAGNRYGLEFRIIRDSTDISGEIVVSTSQSAVGDLNLDSMGAAAWSLSDVPGAGTFTYKLQIRRKGTSGFAGSPHFSNRTMILLKAKR